MGAFAVAIIMVMAGTVLGAFWTFVVGVTGGLASLFPFFMSQRAASRRRSTAGWDLLSLLSSALGQTYASLTWAVFVVESTRSLVAAQSGMAWPIWIAAWWVSAVSTWAASKDATYAERRNHQHVAMLSITAPLATISFFVFAFFPPVASMGWGWVPHF